MEKILQASDASFWPSFDFVLQSALSNGNDTVDYMRARMSCSLWQQQLAGFLASDTFWMWFNPLSLQVSCQRNKQEGMKAALLKEQYVRLLVENIKKNYQNVIK